MLQNVVIDACAKCCVQFCAAQDKIRLWIEPVSVAEQFTVVPTFVSIYYDRNWLGLWLYVHSESNEHVQNSAAYVGYVVKDKWWRHLVNIDIVAIGIDRHFRAVHVTSSGSARDIAIMAMTIALIGGTAATNAFDHSFQNTSWYFQFVCQKLTVNNFVNTAYGWFATASTHKILNTITSQSHLISVFAAWIDFFSFSHHYRPSCYIGMQLGPMWSPEMAFSKRGAALRLTKSIPTRLPHICAKFDDYSLIFFYLFRRKQVPK